MKSLHAGDTLVVWKARSPRAFGAPTDRHRRPLARERRRVPKSDRRARHDDPAGARGLPPIRRRPRLCSPIQTFGSPRSRRARCRPRFATHWTRRTVETASAVPGRLHRRPRPVCYAARVPSPASTGRQSYQVCGKRRGKRASRVAAGNRSESLPLGVSALSRQISIGDFGVEFGRARR